MMTFPHHMDISNSQKHHPAVPVPLHTLHTRPVKHTLSIRIDRRPRVHDHVGAFGGWSWERTRWGVGAGGKYRVNEMFVLRVTRGGDAGEGLRRASEGDLDMSKGRSDSYFGTPS